MTTLGGDLCNLIFGYHVDNCVSFCELGLQSRDHKSNYGRTRI